jgi:serpin B
MKRFTTIAVVAMATLTVVMGALSPAVKTLGRNNGDFGINLYRKIVEDKSMKGSNIFFSPFSVSTAMAMTYLGAKGKAYIFMNIYLN